MFYLRTQFRVGIMQHHDFVYFHVFEQTSRQCFDTLSRDEKGNRSTIFLFFKLLCWLVIEWCKCTEIEFFEVFGKCNEKKCNSESIFFLIFYSRRCLCAYVGAVAFPSLIRLLLLLLLLLLVSSTLLLVVRLMHRNGWRIPSGITVVAHT